MISELRTHPASARLDVTALGPAPEAAVIARFSCDYAVQYGFSDEAFFANLKESEMRLFSAYNTSFHVWPYAREFIQSMAFRMSLPPVLLQVFRPAELIGTPEKWEKVQRGGSSSPRR